MQPDLAQVKAEAEAAGKLLPQHHPAVQTVRRIGERIAANAEHPGGGGRTDHMKVGALPERAPICWGI